MLYETGPGEKILDQAQEQAGKRSFQVKGRKLFTGSTQENL
jgi:hypothetical protein